MQLLKGTFLLKLASYIGNLAIIIFLVLSIFVRFDDLKQLCPLLLMVNGEHGLWLSASSTRVSGWFLVIHF